MPFPEDLLDPDEELLAHEHPHWRVLAPAVAVLLGVAAAGGFLAAVVRGQSWHAAAWLGLGVLGAVVLARWTLWPVLRRRRTHVVVTDRRVLVGEGVLRRAVVDVPLRAVTAVAYRDRVLERALRTGTLVVDCAGRTPLELADVPRVAALHARLHRAVAEAVEREAVERDGWDEPPRDEPPWDEPPWDDAEADLPDEPGAARRGRGRRRW